MKISPLPENEQERLDAVESYHILDTEDEQDFDSIVELASQVCDTPIALITLVDKNRQWFKSKTGLDIKETHRNLSFCAHAIHMKDVMIVSDASQDDRFFDNPLVTGDPHIRFYAGMPLITSNGFKLGTLAVIDRKPRELSNEQLTDLRILGKQVVNLLDLRCRNLELENLVLEKTTEIKDAFERNKLIMESSLDAIINMDHKGAITFWNPQAVKIFGWKEEEMLGRQLAETIIPYQHRQQHLQGMTHYLKTGVGLLLNKLIEITALNREGKEFPIELTIAPIKEGKNEFFCAFIRDITERKKQEAFLLESKENLERAEQQAKLGSWYVEVGSGKRHWSKQMFRFFRLDPLGEIPGFDDTLKLYHPDDRSLLKASFEKMQHGEEPEAILLRTNPALMPLRYLLPSWRIISDAAGKPIKFEGTLLDYTQQKISADKLAESENRLRTIIQTEPECIKLMDANCELLDMNSAGLAMIETETLEQVIGHSVLGLVDAKYKEPFLKLIAGVFNGKAGTLEFEMTSLKGSNRWIETHEVPFRNAKGIIVSALGISKDITERKKIEQSLSLAEERYRSIFDNALIGIYQSSPDGKFIMANPAMAKMFGYSSPEELISTISNIATQVYADQQERQRLRELIKKDRKALGYEFKVFKKDGEIIWVRDNVRAVYNSEGQIKYYEGSLKDITEQKTAEAQIIKEKDLADSIINSLPGIFYLYDSAGKFIRWNKNFETVSGYSAIEIANMHPSEFYEEGEERDMVVARISEVFTKGFAEVETNFLLKDKRKIPYYFNGWKIEYENQTCLIGVGIDIAERKKAEDELRESEIYLRGILDSTTDGILAIDTNGKVISSNNRFKELWHIPEELMALKDDHALLTYVLSQLVDPEEFLRKVEDLYRSNRTDFDILQFKDGRIFERHYNPLVLNKNRVGKVWSFRDATDRKKAEEKLRNSENKLRAFFRSMPDASVLLGRNFEILAFSDAGYDLNASTYGTELHEGDIFIDKIFPEVRPLIIEFVLKALNGEISKGEFPIPNIKTGHSVWWLAVFMPAYDSDGNIFGVVANSTNINELKRAELKLKKQFEELQKTNHELDRFVYSASHDLRAPLSSILGLINVAELEAPTPAFKKYLDMIRSSINRLDGFIKDILTYSRNSRMDVHLEKINFHELMGLIQNSLIPIIGAERLKVSLEINDDVYFYSDRDRLEIILNNLFSNGLKYQDFHKESSRLSIHIATLVDKVEIRFSDNGIGIGEKHLDKIFNMFYRATENAKGAGLGLFIAKEAVTKLGGTINVESEFGLSTTFEITIPNSTSNS